MKLATVVFPSDQGHTQLDELARVLDWSVRKNSPATPLTIVREEGATGETESRGEWLANVGECSRRLRAWARLVDALPDGDVMGLLDADTVVLRDLSSMAGARFDAAVTVRPSFAAYPLNAGVIFVRGGDTARLLIRRWVDKDAELRRTGQADAAILRHGSVDQAALWAVLPEFSNWWRIDRLACRWWNCEDSTWHLFDHETRILHIKGKLRRCAFGQRAPSPEIRAAFEAFATLRDEMLTQSHEATKADSTHSLGAFVSSCESNPEPTASATV